MPAVYLNSEQNAENRNRKFLVWMKGRMAELGIKQKDVASELHITQQAVGSMMIRKGSFSAIQMMVIFKVLQASDEEILKFMKL